MESHGKYWKVPWKVPETAGTFHGKSRKPLEVSTESHGNFQMILRTFGFIIMVTRKEFRTSINRRALLR
jgi:hypothetical protein